MWKNIKGRLVPMTDDSRVRFKTYIAKELLETLNEIADKQETHVGYLIENGLKNLVADPDFIFDKSKRMKGKSEFRTTCDKDILGQAKEIAKQQKLNFTDVIQASIQYIKISEVKSQSWRHRIE